MNKKRGSERDRPERKSALYPMQRRFQFAELSVVRPLHARPGEPKRVKIWRKPSPNRGDFSLSLVFLVVPLSVPNRKQTTFFKWNFQTKKSWKTKENRKDEEREGTLRDVEFTILIVFHVSCLLPESFSNFWSDYSFVSNPKSWIASNLDLCRLRLCEISWLRRQRRYARSPHYKSESFI